MPESTDIAYTAGIIDGEGCIRMQKNFGLCLAVGNTELALLDWLQLKWGGRVYGHSRALEKWYPRSKPFAQWQIYGLRAISVIEQCLPYLVIKRYRAEVALRMKPLINKRNNYLPGYNESLRVQRQSIYDELKVLNQRGIAI